MIRRILCLVSLAALAALGSGCSSSPQAGGPPQGAEPEVTVATIAPQQVTLTTVLSGRTSAFLVSDVRPQVGGIIQKRLFKEGADVRAGEVLYQIDPATFQAAYETAKATLAKAEANALPAKLKGERFSGLSKVRAVSQQDNDEAQAARHQAEAEVSGARAALEAARINLSYTRITAPISGRIGKSSVTPGALVTANQAAALATIQQTDSIYVDVTQSSTEVMRMKRDLASGRMRKSAAGGARVKLLFEDGTEYPVEGSLQFSDITVDQGTGSITLRAVFPNKNQELLPGLYVRAVLEEGVEDQAILVPQAAVTRDPKGNPLVMAVKADSTVEARPIGVSRAVGDKWLVTSGLAAGDKVIVAGLQKVRPGAKVKAVEAGAAPADQANATAPQPSAPPAAAPEAQPAAQPAAKPEAQPSAQPAAKAEAKAPLAAPAPVKKREALVYSPAKDQTIPASEATGQQPEARPESQPQQQPAQQ